jgi:hypothetical protein
MSKKQTEQPVCGVIYVAVGERCTREAEQSLVSLRRTNPDVKAMLLTDVDIADASKWDKLEVDASLNVQTQNKSSCKGKLNMDRAPWDRCLYLDSDTVVVRDLSPGFALLDRFEFVGEQVGGGHHYEIPGLPSSFPEISGGVFFWRPTEKVKAFFRKWREYYEKYDQSHEMKTFDQKSMRIAMWESDLSFGKMPSTFNLMPYSPRLLEREVVVLHGRGEKTLETMHRRASWSDELRVYVPGVGEIRHPKDMSWQHTLYVIWRMLAWKVRSLCGR